MCTHVCQHVGVSHPEDSKFQKNAPAEEPEDTSQSCSQIAATSGSPSTPAPTAKTSKVKARDTCLIFSLSWQRHTSLGHSRAQGCFVELCGATCSLRREFVLPCKSYTSRSSPTHELSHSYAGKIKGKREGGVPRGRSLLLVDPR